MHLRSRECLKWPTVVLCGLLAVGCREEVLHDVDEEQANRAQLALAQVGIDAKKSRAGEGWTISVLNSNHVTAIETLLRSRIPRPSEREEDEQSTPLLPTREDRERINLRRAASGVRHTLERIPGVLEAHVHISELLQNVPSDKPSASGRKVAVYLVTNDGEFAKPTEIKNLIGAALGVPFDNTTISIGAAAAPGGESVTRNSNASMDGKALLLGSEEKTSYSFVSVRTSVALALGITAGLLSWLFLKRSRRLGDEKEKILVHRSKRKSTVNGEGPAGVNLC